MTPEEIQQFNDLKKEVETLKQLFYKDNYSDLEVFRKKVLFKSDATFSGKFGLYGTLPISQQTTALTPVAIFVAGSGTAVKDDSTFDGYTLKQIVKALRNLGLIL